MNAWRIFVLFLMFSLCLYAQKNDIQFEHLAEEHGLSHLLVYSVLQDRRGFMWFATEDGLNRYDGISFKVYKHNPEDPKSLGSNSVTHLCEDREGNIWISTRNQGLDKFEPKTETFVHYRYEANNPNSLSHNYVNGPIYEDACGILWIGTNSGGLNRFHPKKKAFTHYRHDKKNPHSLSHDSVKAIASGTTQEGTPALWIATFGGGLNLFDIRKNSFMRYRHDKNNPESLVDDKIKCLYVDSRKNVVWVGTVSGLDRFDPQKGVFCHYKHDAKNPYSLSGDDVWNIQPGHDDDLWIATLGNGLNHFFPGTGKFSRYSHEKENPKSLSHNTLQDLYIGKDSALWIASIQGVNRFDPHRKKFKLYQHRPHDSDALSCSRVFRILEDPRGMIWIATQTGGLNCLDPEKEIFTNFQNNPEDPHSLSQNGVSDIYQDNTGTLWVATSHGLNQWNPHTKTFIRYFHSGDNPFSISENSLRALGEDSQGNLWVGTFNTGLNRLDRRQNKFFRYTHDPHDPYSICSNNIWKIFRDSTGILWIGTGNGLCKFDQEKGRFIRFVYNKRQPGTISDNTILSFCEESADVLWVGTGMGLNRFDKKTEQFTHFFEKNGLSSNRINSIVADDHGYLWMGTSKGISRFHLQKQKFRNYDIQDGLQGNLFFFSSALKSKDGKIYMGGPNGLNVFDPKEIQDNPHIPPVLLTDFNLFRESVPIGKESVLKQHISFTEKIILSYKESFIGFEFAALNYTASKKNRYVYMLEGFDTSWIHTDSSRRFAHYSHLEPGEYVFYVKGSNNDGLWNEKAASVKIILLPPFWRTFWFKTIMVILTMGSILGSISLRIKNMKARNQQLEQQKKELENEVERRTEAAQSANRAKTEFLAIMSHEIRTPMNAIIGLTYLALDMEQNPRQKEYLQKILTSSKSLLGIMNDLLDISKIESGKMELEQIPFSLDEVLGNVKNIISLKAEEKGLRLCMESDPQIPLVLLGDPLRLGQILINLMSNAVKFTKQGEVSLVVKISLWDNEENKIKICFSVQDTGIGMTQEEIGKIFQPFTQVDASITRKYGGTGLGLSIAKAFVEKMGGKIQANSSPGQGTLFTFSIILGYKEEEKRTHLHPYAKKELQENSINTKTVDISALEPLLAEFYKLLKKHSINAKKELPAIYDHLKNTQWEKELEILENYLKKYDFKNAKDLFIALAEQMQITINQ